MACKYPKRFQSALTRIVSASVLNGTDVVICLNKIECLPCVFYAYNQLGTVAGATDTMPVYITTASGNVPLLSPTLSAITYGELVSGTVIPLAKINVCSSTSSCNCCDSCSERITYIQVLGYNTPATTTATP